MKCRGKMGEIPVLHHDQQVHDQNEGRQERTGQLCMTPTDGHFPLNTSIFIERLGGLADNLAIMSASMCFLCVKYRTSENTLKFRSPAKPVIFNLDLQMFHTLCIVYAS